jgi:hypothetical protein
VLAVIWRTTSALPDLQRFGLAGGVVVVAGWLMRLRSVDITEDEDHGRQPWTYWAPLVTAFALIVALKRSRREARNGRGPGSDSPGQAPIIPPLDLSRALAAAPPR